LTDVLFCPNYNMDQQEPGCDAEQIIHMENNATDTPEGKIQ